MGPLQLSLFWIISVFSKHIWSLDIAVQVGDNVTLPCNENNRQYPSWRGPSTNDSFSLYTYEGDPTFSPRLLSERLHRFQWDTRDNRSLIISNVSLVDSGNYTCTNDETIHLFVRVLSKPEISSAEWNDTHVYTFREREDQPFNLTCSTSKSFPEPSLKWYKYANKTGPLTSTRSFSNLDDGFVNLTETLTMTATRKEDGVEYVCEAAFGLPYPVSRAVKVVLDLILKPAQPILTSNRVTEHIQSDVAVCVTSGFKPADIQIWWELNRKNHTGDTNITKNTATSTFNMTSVFSASLTRDRNGQILKCFAFHESLEAPLIVSTNLSVLFKPEFATLTGQTTGLTADGVTKLSLNCTSGVSNPTPEITWIVANRTVISNLTVIEMPGEHNGIIVSQRLELLADRTLDKTEIFCLVDNHIDANPVQSNIKLINLFYHPEVAITGPNEVVEYETLIPLFRCTADANPPPQFSWFHDDKAIHDNIVDAGSVSEFSLPSINRTHAGTYTCIANNNYGPEGRATVELVVKSKAFIDSFTSVSENGLVRLRCLVDSYPPANVTIVKEGDVLANTTGNNLLEHAIGEFDCLASGTYTCKASKYNGVGPDTSSIDITTRCLPQSLKQVEFGTNALSKLEVTVLAYPEPSSDDVHWSRYIGGEWRTLNGSYIIPVTHNTFVCGLTLSNMGQPDFGYYRVDVKNGFNATFTQMFNVEAADSSVQETTESSTNRVLWYSVSSLAGVVVGIVLACTCLYIRGKCAGDNESGPFGCLKSRQAEPKTDAEYEEIAVKANGSCSPQNLYSDLNAVSRTNESDRDTNEPKKAASGKEQEKGDIDTYMDMSGTQSVSSSKSFQAEHCDTEPEYVMPGEVKDTRTASPGGPDNGMYVCMNGI